MPNPDIIRLGLTFFAFIFLFGVFVRPIYGALSYVIIMMLQPGLYYPVLRSMRIELLAAIFLMIMIVFSGRLSKINHAKEPIFLWTFIFTIVVALSTFQAFDFQTSWDRMIEFLKVYFLFLIIFFFSDNTDDIYKLLWVFFITTSILGYEPVYNFAHGILRESFGARADYAVASQGLSSGHVASANLQLQALPVAWFLGVCSDKRKIKVVGTALFFLSVYVVVISASRGGITGLIALMACISYFSKRRYLTLAIGSVIFTLMLLSMGGKYLGYISTLLDGFDSGLSASSRVSGFKHGFEMMLKRPVLGVGPGCYPVARTAWFGWSLWSHNHYGQLMGDLGLAGTIVWFIFLSKYMKSAKQIITDKETNRVAVNIFRSIIVITIVRLVLGMGSHSLYTFIWYMLAAITSSFMIRNRLAKMKN